MQVNVRYICAVKYLVLFLIFILSFSASAGDLESSSVSKRQIIAHHVFKLADQIPVWNVFPIPEWEEEQNDTSEENTKIWVDVQLSSFNFGSESIFKPVLAKISCENIRFKRSILFACYRC